MTDWTVDCISSSSLPLLKLFCHIPTQAFLWQRITSPKTFSFAVAIYNRQLCNISLVLYIYVHLVHLLTCEQTYFSGEFECQKDINMLVQCGTVVRKILYHFDIRIFENIIFNVFLFRMKILKYINAKYHFGQEL